MLHNVTNSEFISDEMRQNYIQMHQKIMEYIMINHLTGEPPAALTQIIDIVHCPR